MPVLISRGTQFRNKDMLFKCTLINAPLSEKCTTLYNCIEGIFALYYYYCYYKVRFHD